MTFLLLSVRTYARNVGFDGLMGVIVESCWTPSQTDPPVPATNSGCISVDGREWEAPNGRRPQPRR